MVNLMVKIFHLQDCLPLTFGAKLESSIRLRQAWLTKHTALRAELKPYSIWPFTVKGASCCIKACMFSQHLGAYETGQQALLLVLRYHGKALVAPHHESS